MEEYEIELEESYYPLQSDNQDTESNDNDEWKNWRKEYN